MQQSQPQYCQVQGCSSKKAPRREFCKAHELKQRDEQKAARDAKKVKTSLCCGVSCTKGELHPYGTQYCSKCKEACLWKTIGV